VAARHILGKPSDGIKPTFVWSSFGGLHLRSAGSYLNQYSDVKYLSTGDKHVCLYYNKDTEIVTGAATINADPVVARFAESCPTKLTDVLEKDLFGIDSVLSA